MEATATKATFQKYPAYKDSGSDWSGQIPVDWESLPIRAIFEERNEKNDGPKTDFILSVTKDRGVIPYDEKGQIGNNKSEDIERYKVVYPNDFVINKMNVIIGSLGMSKYFGAFSQVYLVYKPKSSRINIEYYSYIFSNPSFYKSLIRFCTGIMELRESLNKNDFKKIILPFPDFNTQTAIVRFLNDKTAKIDRAIAQKEKMIALLKERKQIIIQNAVTKGLDPNVKMKDSGVEWIGEIPEGWEVKKLKYVLNLRNEKVSSLNSNLPYVGMENIESKSGKYIESKSEVEGLANSFQKGNILFGKLRPYLAKVYLAEFDGICSTEFLVYQCSYPDYFSKFLLSDMFIQVVNASTYGAKMPRASSDFIGNLEIPIPLYNEQILIVQEIINQSTKIDQAISLQQTQIQKLKEYKATLIDSAVTGKIKVS